jgi:hypothetical protein
MKVKCITINMKEETQKLLFLFSAPLINEDVIIGETYTVYGISLWKNYLHYLLVSEESGRNGGPDWYPAELFEIVDNALPKMYFTYLENDSRGLNALWGYEEMVFDFNHYINLIERESHAMEVFFKHKKEYDTQGI